MIDHDGCDSCKHFSTTICVPEESPCFDCENAHKRKTLVDKYEPMTNADRIRSITDEELKDELWKWKTDYAFDNSFRFPNDILEWLQRAKESEEE